MIDAYMYTTTVDLDYSIDSIVEGYRLETHLTHVINLPLTPILNAAWALILSMQHFHLTAGFCILLATEEMIKMWMQVRGAHT